VLAFAFETSGPAAQTPTATSIAAIVVFLIALSSPFQFPDGNGNNLAETKI
jgi:hypothetical protein